MLKKVLTLCTLGFVSAISAHAITIFAGNTGIPATPLSYGGTAVNFFGGSITTPSFSSNYAINVYSDPNNVYCPGCMDFVFQIDNTGSSGLIYSVNGLGFAGFSTTAGFLAAGGLPPTDISRSLDGNTISFNFGGKGSSGVGPHSLSDLLIVQTNGLSYTGSTFTLTDVTGTSGSGGGLGPLNPTPEPSSLLLFGTGLIGLAGFAKKKLIS